MKEERAERRNREKAEKAKQQAQKKAPNPKFSLNKNEAEEVLIQNATPNYNYSE